MSQLTKHERWLNNKVTLFAVLAATLIIAANPTPKGVGLGLFFLALGVAPHIKAFIQNSQSASEPDNDVKRTNNLGR